MNLAVLKKALFSESYKFLKTEITKKYEILQVNSEQKSEIFKIAKHTLLSYDDIKRLTFKASRGGLLSSKFKMSAFKTI